MEDVQFGRVVRALRRRRLWRQGDVSARAGVHRSTVSLIERGRVGGLTLDVIRRCVAPLAATAELALRWRGPELDRLLDERHAAVEAAWKGRLDRWGWVVEAEASFNRYGERGRVDLLAWHPEAGTVLVVEIKTVVVDLQDLLGRLDVKRRLAPWLARERGWSRPRRVLPVLFLPDSTPAREVVRRLAPLFEGFDLRGRAAVAALHRPALFEPASPTGLLIFSDLRPATGGRAKSVGASRVRTRPAQPSTSGDAALASGHARAT